MCQQPQVALQVREHGWAQDKFLTQMHGRVRPVLAPVLLRLPAVGAAHMQTSPVQTSLAMEGAAALSCALQVALRRETGSGMCVSEFEPVLMAALFVCHPPGRDVAASVRRYDEMEWGRHSG